MSLKADGGADGDYGFGCAEPAMCDPDKHALRQFKRNATQGPYDFEGGDNHERRRLAELP